MIFYPTCTTRGFFRRLTLLGLINQIPIVEIDIPKIVVATPYSSFDVHRMPFGIRSATQNATFQKFTNGLFQGPEFVTT